MTKPDAGGSGSGSPVRRLLFVGLGLLFVSLGFLGAILPGLPATPFFLLAAFFFARSSPRLHHWLVNSPVAGPLIREWERPGGGVRWEVKVASLTLLPCVIAASIYLGGLSGWRMLGLIGLGLIGATVIVLLPLARPVPPTKVLSKPFPVGQDQTDERQQHPQKDQADRLPAQDDRHSPTVGQPPRPEMPDGVRDRQDREP